MSEANLGTEGGRQAFWKRRWFWIGGGTVALLAVVAAATPRAWARGFPGHGFGPGGRHGFSVRLAEDPEAAKRHAGMAVEWVLRGVNASDEQKQQAKRIAERAIDQAGPLAARHRDHREAMARELAKPEIDRDALERLRREEMALADTASKLAVGAIADLGEVLTAEQRAELVAFAHRFHAEGRGH